MHTFCVFLIIQLPQHLRTKSTSPLRSSVQSTAVTLFSRQRQCQTTAATGSTENIGSTYDRNDRRSTVAVSCTVAATRDLGRFILQHPSFTLPKRRMEHIMCALCMRTLCDFFGCLLMTNDACHRIMWPLRKIHVTSCGIRLFHHSGLWCLR